MCTLVRVLATAPESKHSMQSKSPFHCLCIHAVAAQVRGRIVSLVPGREFRGKVLSQLAYTKEDVASIFNRVTKDQNVSRAQNC